MAYSILSLDGGGSWALIQVKILQKRYGEQAKGHDVLNNYDMVIANSGGSMVLAAMCVNMPLDKILDLFLDEKILQSIFVRNFISRINPLRQYFPRFKTIEKLNGLRKQLGDVANKPLNDFPEYIGKPKLQIIITGFDYDRERAVYFRSNSKSRMDGSIIQQEINPNSPIEEFKTVSLLHAVHAASNAPVLFFDDPAAFSYYYPNNPTRKTKIRRFWDGAIGGNNNPVASGVLEAISNNAKPDEIRIVSIGTANTLLPVLYGDDNEPSFDFDWLVKFAKDEGTFGDFRKMAQAIISDPPDAATFIANHILGLPYIQTQNKLIRLNPLVKPIFNSSENKWKKPGDKWTDKDLKRLFEMDMAVTEAKDVQLINHMTEEYFKGYFQNQGIRLGGRAMEPILGHLDFQSGFEDWKSWDAVV